ncbi:Putative protein [Zobellia galactanivorans]|uniref:Uncharacterized protein n=1 Tax=Zobellia galactanivorans (strain DSM 12802 / CCUG 47099 / CIP 106680 / NCIMB 13871 / Dsij) TaxID=63186 RepID=G0L4H1_ZOBGA|nr:Putative protein [Zobellia galactanivorans]
MTFKKGRRPYKKNLEDRLFYFYIFESNFYMCKNAYVKK